MRIVFECEHLTEVIVSCYTCKFCYFFQDKLSKENQLVALEKIPTVLEVFAHSYFPASFLIGPQFPIKRYIDFVELKLEKKVSH